MVASSHVIGAADRISPQGIDAMLLTRTDESPPSSPLSVIRSNELSKIHTDPRKERVSAITNTTRKSVRMKMQQRSLSSTDSKSNDLRRIQSDSLDQSKRDDPNSRRSIFGHYFKEQPRSSSAPHLERGQPQPSGQPQKATSSIRLSPKRSLSISSKYKSPQANSDLCDGNRSNRNPSSNPSPSHEGLSIDYRVFAPSEQQAEESAICSRYRELNKEHEKDYDSVLERQVQIERSLPPFPSPLIRFCSETTVTVAGPDLYSSVRSRPSDSKRGGFRNYGEIHYSGVYSLLTPSSVLRPSTYNNCNKTATTAIQVPVEPSTLPNDSRHDMSTQTRTENSYHYQDDPSALLPPSFNLSRSFIENPAKDEYRTASLSEEKNEEKKENDNAFMYSPTNGTILMIKHGSDKEPSSSNAPSAPCTSDDIDDVYDSRNRTELSQAVLHPQTQPSRFDQRVTFDPRVTVTEFEDPIPRKWYDDSELDQHKREAIALAQAYLRKHPAVLKRYRQPILDPITKTTRKRALFSLPVFSSTFSNSDINSSQGIHNGAVDVPVETLQNRTSLDSSSPSSVLLETGQSTPSVKKILIVHPNRVISSLFCKSMHSMFPSAELVTAGSFDEASRLVRQSFTQNNKVLSLFSTGTDSFDIIVIEQRLTKDNSIENTLLNSIFKSFDKGPLGLLDVCMKTQVDFTTTEETAMPLTHSQGMHYGCTLIQQVCELSSHKKQKHCLLIGLSFRPEVDKRVMMQAGADIVWGLPIPSVGDDLRNQLLAKLRAKRCPVASNPSGNGIRK